MLTDYSSDEHAGWPSYVDFLASFAFVLIIFIACLTYIVSGAAEQRRRAEQMQAMSREFAEAGIENEIEGLSLRISLKDKVSFETSRSDLRPSDAAYLREAGRKIAGHPECRRVVVQGFADSVPFRGDPFGNWDLSTKRALTVLRFFYLCEDCGYGDDIRDKLVLAGDGSQSAEKVATGSAQDRRVDVVLDCSSESR
jgi:flagellar motor protein MotB